ncbi:MAG TPA: hypothetical protein GX507_06490 [Clostridia bacterium]|nr:hypothetical protein [Clostridia bacterium]
MMVTDIRDFMDDDSSPAPGRPGRLARYLGRIVMSDFAHPPGELVETGVLCRRRPGHRRCTGYIRVVRAPDTGEVEWICPECGDCGVVYNWRGTCWDIQKPLWPH